MLVISRVYLCREIADGTLSLFCKSFYGRLVDGVVLSCLYLPRTLARGDFVEICKSLERVVSGRGLAFLFAESTEFGLVKITSPELGAAVVAWTLPLSRRVSRR